jgi:hypothetical protein
MIDLSKDQKASIFDRIFEEYVAEHGLGGMSKADFDALLLWLVVSNLDEVNSFEISNKFKIKEGRVKSLLETAAVKFDKTKDYEAWQSILEVLSRVEFDIESLEKGQIRFQLKNPMLFRWLQEQIRNLHSTCSYHRSSEQVTMNLDVLYTLFDNLWEQEYLGDPWKGKTLKTAQSHIKKAIGNVGKKIEKNTLEELREMKKPKLRSILETGATLSSIGSFISPLIDKINS